MNKSDEEALILLVGAVAVYYLYTQGKLSFLDKILKPGGGGGGGPAAPGGGSGGSGPQPSGELDENGVKLIYATTGNFVDIQEGSDHENGQRYNVNHKFADHMIIGYWHATGGTNNIGHKTDGPNHGGCSSAPECRWIDPDLNLSDCSVAYGAEFPHPDANDLECPSCTSCNQDLHDKWVGTASIVYGPPGDRWHELWVDPGGLVNDTTPANQWMQLLKENYTKQIPAEWQRTEHPTNFDAGFEAEIRKC